MRKLRYFIVISFLLTLFGPQLFYGQQLNTYVGDQALQNNTTGIDNSAFGFRALRLNTISSGNSAFGANALAKNTGTGRENTAIGSGALFSNTSGSFNTATGFQALNFNSSGAANTATGFRALRFNTSGFDNTAIGMEALRSNITGSHNTATGKSALASNKTGQFNVANGNGALMFNTSGNDNTAIGTEALSLNSTGSFNTASGTQALFSNTSGSSNTAIGSNALYANTLGSGNIAIGSSALRANIGNPDLANGSDNIAIGSMALGSNTKAWGSIALGSWSLTNTTGGGNTAIGSWAGPEIGSNTNVCTFIGLNTAARSDSVLFNSTAIGHSALITADNQVRIGNTLVTSIGGQVNFTAFSDSRYKKNIRENVPGLAFINKLRPITYTLDVEGLDNKQKAMRPNLRVDSSIALKPVQVSAEELKAKEEKARIVYTGFVAQEVEQAAKELTYQFSGVDAPKNKEDLYGLRYAEFVVPLVKAVQELSAENQQLRKELSELKELVNKKMKG